MEKEKKIIQDGDNVQDIINALFVPANDFKDSELQLTLDQIEETINEAAAYMVSRIDIINALKLLGFKNQLVGMHLFWLIKLK